MKIGFRSVLIRIFTALCVIMVLFAAMAMIAPKNRDYEGHWAEKYIDKMIEDKILEGYPDGTFKPDATISRQEFAAVLKRAMNYETKAHPLVFGTTEGI